MTLPKALLLPKGWDATVFADGINLFVNPTVPAILPSHSAQLFECKP